MKIDFETEIKNLRGESVRDNASNEILTLSSVLVEVLLLTDKDNPLEGKEKMKRYSLAKDIYDGNKDSLSAEEVVLLKDLVGKYTNTLIAGQVFLMLNDF